MDENGPVLKIGQNGCTKEVEIHPVRSDVWHMYPVDVDDNTKANYATLIIFDKRQVWHAYYYSDVAPGWVVVRKGLHLKMTGHDFERFFGKYEVTI